MKKNKDLKKEDFKKDIKSKESFLNPLKKIIKKKTLKNLKHERRNTKT